MDAIAIVARVLKRNGIAFSSIAPIIESNHNFVFSVDDAYVVKWQKSNSLLSREFLTMERLS